MKEDDITIAKFISQSQLVTTSAAGSYRKIVARGEDISFDIVEVQNTNQDLLTVDYRNEGDPVVP